MIYNNYYVLIFNKDKYDTFLETISYINDNDIDIIKNKILKDITKYAFIELEGINSSNKIYNYFMYILISNILSNNLITRTNKLINDILNKDIIKLEEEKYKEGNNIKSIKWIKCENECNKELVNIFNKEKTLTITWISIILNYIINPYKLTNRLVLTISKKKIITNFW